MLKKNKQGIYQFGEFERFDFLIHGISTKRFPHCVSDFKQRKFFLSSLGLKIENLVLAQQVHGNKIKVVENKDKGQTILGVDGLITETFMVILGIKTADCLPLFLLEPEKKIIGIAHAGWKGILKKLPQKMIDQMIKMGGLPENILVAIGPHICQNCYDINQGRIKAFLSAFGKVGNMIKENKYLDLFIPTKIQLLHSGILEKNIFHTNLCTSCHNNEFFSYRKERQKNIGENLSVISLII